MPSIGERLLYSYARQFPFTTGKQRLVDALWRYVVPADDTRRIARLEWGAFAMPCDLRQQLQRQFYFFGTYWRENHVLQSWCAFTRHAHVIFDVGANAGIFSLAALATQPR